jgi:hypothetical protein
MFMINIRLMFAKIGAKEIFLIQHTNIYFNASDFGKMGR